MNIRPLRALGALLLLCCVRVAPAAELEQASLTLAVGGKGLFYYLPLTLAERLGYFKDEGLTVEVVDFPGGAKALRAKEFSLERSLRALSKYSAYSGASGAPAAITPSFHVSL